MITFSVNNTPNYRPKHGKAWWAGTIFFSSVVDEWFLFLERFMASLSNLNFKNSVTTLKKGLFIDLIIKRPILHNFMVLFLPTGMLITISQVSTAFSQSFKDMVIEVNTTLLLVLTTL